MSATCFISSWNCLKLSANDGSGGMTSSFSDDDKMFARGQPPCPPLPLVPQRSPLARNRENRWTMLGNEIVCVPSGEVKVPELRSCKTAGGTLPMDPSNGRP